jgi:4-hydroxy-tetrahydrodipicolinate synthase
MSLVTLKLTGTIVPLVTPFGADESLDLLALRRLIAFVLEQGADGLMPTALTGEGLPLTRTETLAVWDVVFSEARERLPIIPAVIATTTRRAIKLVQAAEARGASAVIAVLGFLYAFSTILNAGGQRDNDR